MKNIVQTTYIFRKPSLNPQFCKTSMPAQNVQAFYGIHISLTIVCHILRLPHLQFSVTSAVELELAELIQFRFLQIISCDNFVLLIYMIWFFPHLSCEFSTLPIHKKVYFLKMCLNFGSSNQIQLKTYQ